MTVADTTRLADLVMRKHACLLQLRELGRRQFEMIGNGDMTQLLGLLAVKQRSLDELHDLEKGLDPYRLDDPARRVWSGEAERLRCASLADQSTRLLADVMETERRCEDSLRHRRDETAQQLAIIRTADATRGAYVDAATSRVTASTLDLTTES